MFIKRNLKNKNGQALVEAALIAPLMVFFLFTVIWFGRIMLTWQQISGAARYGTDLIAYTPFSKQYIKNDIKDYLCNNLTVGRTLNRDMLTVNVHINDLNSPIDFTLDNFISMDLITNPFGVIRDFFDRLETVWEILNPLSFINLSDDKSYVEISYKYKAPPIMRFYKEYIIIKARSEVLADTGSPGSQLTKNARDTRK